MEQPVVVSFPDSSAAEASKYASSLQDALRLADPTILTERVREVEDSQSFGPSLEIILGTASVTALAKGIGFFISRYGTAKIEIKRGNVVVSGLQSKDVAHSLKEIFGQEK